jgi:hypothetical protein
MEYKPYQHVEKLGTAEVEGILKGDVYAFYKIDGTNTCVWLDQGGKLAYGSRKRVLDDSKLGDNQGLVKAMNSPENADVRAELLALLTKHPSWTVYGEWLVPTNLKTYRDDAWRHLYVFDVLDDETGRYLSYDEYSEILKSECPHVLYIPLLAKLRDPTEEDIRALLPRTKEFLVGSGDYGEGIVLKNYEYKNQYGRRTWAKMLTEDYLAHKHESRREKALADQAGQSVEYEIVKLMTVEHIAKEKAKVIELHSADGWDMKMTSELIGRAFDEFFRDNWEIILKKFHSPKIDFKVLKQLCAAKVREVLGV